MLPSSPRKKAFSLIELIAAITVIAIVVIIAFSGLRFVSIRSGSIRCLASLKSLHTATMAYAADHHGSVPIDAGNRSTGVSWYMALKDGYLTHPGYGRRMAPYFCVANRREGSTGGNDGWTNYAVNSNIYDGGTNMGGVPAGEDTEEFLAGRRGPRWQNIGADKALYLDSRNATGGTWYSIAGTRYGNRLWQDSYPVHGNQINVIFVGGHARSVVVSPRSVDAEGNLVDLRADWFWPIR